MTGCEDKKNGGGVALGAGNTRIGKSLTYVPGFWSVKDWNSTVLMLMVTDEETDGFAGCLLDGRRRREGL